MIQEQLKNIIKHAARDIILEYSEGDLDKTKLDWIEKDLSDAVSIEHPKELGNGDFSTQIALLLKDRHPEKNPKALAKDIAERLNAIKPKEVEKIEVAGSGFINFYLGNDFFKKSIQEILLAGHEWGKLDIYKGEKVMVEYTDPNPFKAFHIGHFMSNTIGESISRLVEFSGAEVMRANYQGDVGLHVAKATWGMINSNEDFNTSEDIGRAYTAGSAVYEESEETKTEIDNLNQAIYNIVVYGEVNDKLTSIYKLGKKISLDHFEEIYKKLGTKFDFYFFESEVSKPGIELVEEYKSKVFHKSNGAIVFKGENYSKKLHTRVFITSKGLPTYEAKELGLLKLKEDKYNFDKSITVTASEQTEYFNVVVKAMEQIYPELAKKIKHISHGMMVLPSGKMSSRTGDVVTAEFLINMVENHVSEIMKESDFENKEEIVERISIAALKYAILRQSAGKNIVYDMEKAVSFEGASGPYLQYAHTRAMSVLEKASKMNLGEGEHICTSEISNLEKLLYRFPEVVERSVEEFEPHHIATYLTELASAFNNYYANERILDAETCKSYKLILMQAFQITMQNGLYLLGIKTPEKM